MGIKKITETQVAESVKQSAGVLISQTETIDGNSVECLRKASMENLAQALLIAGIENPDGTAIDAEKLAEILGYVPADKQELLELKHDALYHSSIHWLDEPMDEADVQDNLEVLKDIYQKGSNHAFLYYRGKRLSLSASISNSPDTVNGDMTYIFTDTSGGETISLEIKFMPYKKEYHQYVRQIDAVKPVSKTDEMVAEVGVDGNGKLWFDPRAWEPLDITSFSVVPSGLIEKGAVIDSVTVSWKANKQNLTACLSITGMTDQIVAPKDGGSGKTVTVADLDITYSPQTSPPTIALKVYNGNNVSEAVQKQKTLSFANRVFMGAAESPDAQSTLTSSFIQSLSQSKLSANRSMTAALNADGKKQIWYACPTSMGAPSFYVGGFEGGFEQVAANFPHTNSYGYTENY